MYWNLGLLQFLVCFGGFGGILAVVIVMDGPGDSIGEYEQTEKEIQGGYGCNKRLASGHLAGSNGREQEKDKGNERSNRLEN